MRVGDSRSSMCRGLAGILVLCEESHRLNKAPGQRRKACAVPTGCAAESGWMLNGVTVFSPGRLLNLSRRLQEQTEEPVEREATLTSHRHNCSYPPSEINTHGAK